MRTSTEEMSFLKGLGLTHTTLFRHAMRVLKQKAADLTLDEKFIGAREWIPKSKIKLDTEWTNGSLVFIVESIIFDEDDDISDVQCVDQHGAIHWISRANFNTLIEVKQ